MLFIVFGILSAIANTVVLFLDKNEKYSILQIIWMDISVLFVFGFFGSVFNFLYYRYGNTYVEYQEVELYPTYEIELSDYVHHKDITVMDIERNIIKIDFDNIEVTFSQDETILYKKIMTPKSNVWKLFLFEQYHYCYSLQLRDPLLQYK